MIGSLRLTVQQLDSCTFCSVARSPRLFADYGSDFQLRGARYLDSSAWPSGSPCFAMVARTSTPSTSPTCGYLPAEHPSSWDRNGIRSERDARVESLSPAAKCVKRQDARSSGDSTGHKGRAVAAGRPEPSPPVRARLAASNRSIFCRRSPAESSGENDGSDGSAIASLAVAN